MFVIYYMGLIINVFSSSCFFTVLYDKTELMLETFYLIVFHFFLFGDELPLYH